MTCGRNLWNAVILLLLGVCLMGIPASAITANDDEFVTDFLTGLFQGENVLDNDVPDSTPLVAELVSEPSHGFLQLDPDGVVNYLGDLDFIGTDSFQYRAWDGVNYSNIATVTIILKPPKPYANNDSFITGWQLGSFCYPDPMNNVVLNDVSYTDILTAELVSSPTRGWAELWEGGIVIYCPYSAFLGSDSFQYRAFDGEQYSDPATVTMTVVSAPIPIVCKSPEYTILKNTTLNGFTTPHSECQSVTCMEFVDTPPSHGTVYLYEGPFEYIPDPGFTGTDSFTYYYEADYIGTRLCTATVTIHVVDPPPEVPEFPIVEAPLILGLGMATAVFLIGRKNS